MLGKYKFGLLMAIFFVLALALVACQPEQVETVREVVVTRVVMETEVVEGEPVEVTRVVTETETVTEVVEVTPEPEEAAPMAPADTTTFVYQTYGDTDSLDPALAYDTASGMVLEQVYESLITYDHKDAVNFVPALAMEVPSIDNGLISEDGLTYTFNIRPGVTFHNGATLEPSDAAYTFQRGLLQSDPNGPQWLLLEPILGYSATYDVTEEIADGAYAGDPEGLIANATPEELVAVCEKVKAAIVADDDAGTLTFNLAQPWGPFISTLAGYWGSVMDQDWAIEQGDWDGDCATWQNYYAPGAENSKLTSVANGTGPFMLEYWTPGEETSLVRNDNYWRTEETPKWEGGPYGPAKLERVVRQIVDEWGTRFAAMQAGDADYVTVNPEAYPQMDPLVGEVCDFRTEECAPSDMGGFLTKLDQLASTCRTDMFMNFNIPQDSPFIGSGQMDGNGIPSDFFNPTIDGEASPLVRQAFASCFNYDAYIEQVLQGLGTRNNGPIIKDMLGYNEDGPMYEYDPEVCAANLEEAGIDPEIGFRLQVAYNTGNTTRQTIAEILQSELGAINPLYQVEAVGLPWPTYLRTYRAGQLPVAISGWCEDIHDPHNWVQPYLIGTYAGRQNMPQTLIDKYNEMITAAVLAPTPEEREQIYYDLQEQVYNDIPTVFLAQVNANRYYQPWVQGEYYNSAYSSPIDFYAVWKE